MNEPVRVTTENQWVKPVKGMPQWQGSPAGQDMGDQFFRMLMRFAAMGVLYFGAKAADAHYERSHDTSLALQHGIEAGRRFHTWLFFVGLWFIATVITLFSLQAGPWLIPSWVIGTTLSIGVPYVRVIDYALLRRGVMYHIFRPLSKALIGLPNSFLYTVVPILSLALGLLLFHTFGGL